MPLDMPESVLVRFSGTMQPGITLRDLVHAIPYYAIQEGLLTVEKAGKKNIFSGRVLEIEGLSTLKCEQAFELSDASAERSAAGCTIQLDKEPIIEYLTSNITMLKWMIAEGYGDARTLERRIACMENWIANPKLMERDPDAEYAATIEIDLNEITEPILCAPNDPDDARKLSTVQGEKIDAAQLTDEGYYSIYGRVGARTEMPGCSLCMGNQARVGDKTTVVSTSTRNFPNRLGKGANVYLASTELATVAAIDGKLPTPDEYLTQWKKIDAAAADTYRYLNFDTLPAYTEKAQTITLSPEVLEAAQKISATA